MYQLCDREGIVIVDETPAVGMWADEHYGWDLGGYHLQVLKEMIDRDRNHPCVVMWSLGNEPDTDTLPDKAYEYWHPLYEAAHRLDPQNRPVTVVGCQNRYERDKVIRSMDVVLINRYYGWYNLSGDLEAAKYAFRQELDWWEKQKKPVILSEYGADTVAGLHGAVAEMFTEEYQVAFYEAMSECLDERDFVIGEMPWNFADFDTCQGPMRVGGNRKGLFTRERRPKMAAQGTEMDIRYSCNQRDFKRYTTEEIRKEFLIEKLFEADKVTAVYSHVDRMVTLGVMPVKEKVSIDKGIDIWHNFGTEYFLERRECGMFNVGGAGKVTADGNVYELGYKDCLYLTRGAKEVYFESADAAAPAKFYIVSAPAHCSYENRLIRIADAAKKPCGDAATSNKRVINQFIHPSVLKTCQLSMGMTVLETGSVWNTMPAHTHERRMEVYFYFEVPQDNVVFHMMGEGQETRHIVMQNEQAVISPSWSIHAGAGTSNYTFIWAMGGENQAFDDMDNIPTTELK